MRPTGVPRARIVPIGQHRAVAGLEAIDRGQRAEIHPFAGFRDRRQFRRLPQRPGDHSGQRQTGKTGNGKAPDNGLKAA